MEKFFNYVKENKLVSKQQEERLPRFIKEVHLQPGENLREQVPNGSLVLVIQGLLKESYLRNIGWNQKDLNEKWKDLRQIEENQNEAPPGGDKSILTLADGNQAIPDSTFTRQFAYYSNSSPAQPIRYNSITTLHNEQYQVQLLAGWSM